MDAVWFGSAVEQDYNCMLGLVRLKLMFVCQNGILYSSHLRWQCWCTHRATTLQMCCEGREKKGVKQHVRNSSVLYASFEFNPGQKALGPRLLCCWYYPYQAHGWSYLMDSPYLGTICYYGIGVKWSGERGKKLTMGISLKCLTIFNHEHTLHFQSYIELHTMHRALVWWSFSSMQLGSHLWMRLVSGSSIFFPSLGSSGQRAPN